MVLRRRKLSSFIFFLLLALSSIAAIDNAEALKWNTLFNSTLPEGDSNIFNSSGAAEYTKMADGAFKLTPDSYNEEKVNLLNKSGRVFYKWPVELWSRHDDSIVASFNTAFTINVYRAQQDWEAGEGLAFLIAPVRDFIPENSYGMWLGLTNSTTNGNISNHIVAIEFDTRKQDFDPDDNHIGLNINSVESNKTASLSEWGIQICKYPKPTINYDVWIDYNGTSKFMEVFMAAENDSKPETPVLNQTIDLRDYVMRESFFGFSASTGDPAVELNCVLRWSLAVEELPDKKNWTLLIIVLGVGVPLILIFVIIVAVMGSSFMRKRKEIMDEESRVVDTLKRLPGLPREFRYRDLKTATNNFHESMKLGEGGFGVVYKGTLHDEDQITEIAVKKFSRESVNGKEDFLAELTIIHRLRHKNLVRLFGWCYEKGKILLVYEFMPNGNLENFLYGDASQQPALNWRRRHGIVEGVASALQYLHTQYDQKVLHRDIKSSNILLDSEFNARLGDFGLARALEPERNSYADLKIGGIPGTIGYVAPECFYTGKATPESDVFGFGAVLLEVVCGRRPGIVILHGESQYSLIDWVWMLHRENQIEMAVDERLNNDTVVDEARRLLLLGLACCHPTASERPQAQAIVNIISGALHAPLVSPFKPFFTLPSSETPSSTTESLPSETTSSS